MKAFSKLMMNRAVSDRVHASDCDPTVLAEALRKLDDAVPNSSALVFQAVTERRSAAWLVASLERSFRQWMAEASESANNAIVLSARALIATMLLEDTAVEVESEPPPPEPEPVDEELTEPGEVLELAATTLTVTEASGVAANAPAEPVVAEVPAPDPEPDPKPEPEPQPTPEPEKPKSLLDKLMGR